MCSLLPKHHQITKTTGNTTALLLCFQGCQWRCLPCLVCVGDISQGSLKGVLIRPLVLSPLCHGFRVPASTARNLWLFWPADIRIATCCYRPADASRPDDANFRKKNDLIALLLRQYWKLLLAPPFGYKQHIPAVLQPG